MTKSELKPFHESCIDCLNLLEESLLGDPQFSGNPVVFVIRYSIVVEFLLGQINRTVIPEKHLPQTIESLKAFLQGFIERHESAMINAAFLAGYDVGKFLNESFTASIQNLTERLNTRSEIFIS